MQGIKKQGEKQLCIRAANGQAVALHDRGMNIKLPHTFSIPPVNLPSC